MTCVVPLMTPPQRRPPGSVLSAPAGSLPAWNRSAWNGNSSMVAPLPCTIFGLMPPLAAAAGASTQAAASAESASTYRRVSGRCEARGPCKHDFADFGAEGWTNDRSARQSWREDAVGLDAHAEPLAVLGS